MLKKRSIWPNILQHIRLPESITLGAGGFRREATVNRGMIGVGEWSIIEEVTSRNFQVGGLGFHLLAPLKNMIPITGRSHHACSLYGGVPIGVPLNHPFP